MNYPIPPKPPSPRDIVEGFQVPPWLIGLGLFLIGMGILYAHKINLI